MRIYDQDLFPYEVEELYNAFVTYQNPPYVESHIPTSGEVGVDVGQDIEIIFSKDVNKSSVELSGVISFSPAISNPVYTWSDDDHVVISHDDLSYSTTYMVTVSTGVLDLSGTAMENPYQFSFETQSNIFVSYQPVVFEEAVVNNGSIKNSIVLSLSGDTFATDVVSNGYVTATNVPSGLTPIFVRDSATQITFTLSGNALNHADTNDVDNLTVSFADQAFVTNAATGVSNSTKSNLIIDFNDPNSFGLYPIRDTTLDILNPNYNYGASDTHFIGDGSFVVIEYDLTVLPAGSIINSATLTFSKLDGVGTGFGVGYMINNSGWVEGTKI